MGREKNNDKTKQYKIKTAKVSNKKVNNKNQRITYYQKKHIMIIGDLL